MVHAVLTIEADTVGCTLFTSEHGDAHLEGVVQQATNKRLLARNAARARSLRREETDVCLPPLILGLMVSCDQEDTGAVAEREYYPTLSRILRARRRILLSLFLHHVGRPKGLLRTTVAADLDRYTTQVSQPEYTGQ